MGWLQDWNLRELRTHAWDFSDIDSVATTLFQAALQKQDELEREYAEARRKDYAAAKSEEDRELLFHEDQWEEELNFRRRQALGVLPLHMLCVSVEGRLNRAKRYFDKTHPACPPHKGASWLYRLKDEYEERFGINFEESGLFNRIQDVVLARNAAIHGAGAMDEYLKKIQDPRFVSQDPEFSYLGDQFWVDPQKYAEAVKDAKSFMAWVVGALEGLYLRTTNPGAAAE